MAIVIIGFAILAISFAAHYSEKYDVAIVLAVLGSWLASGAIMWHDIHSHPTSLDVYQGKTTLEITYKDGIPIDSVVVFKNK